MKTNQNGKSLVIGIVIVLIVTIGAATAIYFVTKDNDSAASISAKTKQLPEGYPVEAVPVYQPSTITYASPMAGGWMVATTSTDDVDTVAKSIFDTYTSMGASVTQSPADDQGVGQVIGDSGGHGILITYHTDKDKHITRITYDVKPQK